jgi:N-acetylmuramoyl-L-alanine amidase-like protein/IPT/TIG domain-containing protein
LIPFLGPVAGGNYGASRAGRMLKFNSPNDPAYLVLHTMAGTVASTDATFKRQGSKRSAHYGVELNGSVVQWVRDADSAFHSGDAEFDLASFAITHEDGGETAAPRTDALYAASSSLVRDLCLRYDIPLSRRWVIRHSEVPGVVDSCPDGLDVDRIVAMALVGYHVEPPPTIGSEAGSGVTGVTNGSTPEPGTAAAPAAAASSTASPTNTLQDIAQTIYQDPSRWTDIHSAIQGVVDEVPTMKLVMKMLADSGQVPDGAKPPDGGGNGTPAASTAAPTAAPATPAPKQWGGSQAAIFALQILYLTILAGLAIVYFTNRSLINLPASLGPIPVPIPWFGALGAVLISLVGLTQHRNDWDPSYRFWHWARPLLGASFGTISVLIFQAGILAVGTQPTTTAGNTPKDLLYYLVAFVVGYREETFRELIKRLTDVIFSPGPDAASVNVSSMSPQSGQAAGGTPVTVLGTGFDGTDSVKFGTVQAVFHIDGDGQLSVTSPPGQAGTTVNVAVVAGAVSAIAGAFTYN